MLNVKHVDGRIESINHQMKDNTLNNIYNEIVLDTSITVNML